MSRGPIPRRGGARPQRRRIFVGCEGESERSYAALLQRFADDARRAIHLDAIVLQPGCGDPCALIERAAERKDERSRRFGAFDHAFVLLDADTLGGAPQRDANGLALAQNNGLILIWQRPSHEALLLRHLEDCLNLQPPNSALALQRLRHFWPQYEKNMSRAWLGTRVDLAGARRVASQEADLARLLVAAGLL